MDMTWGCLVLLSLSKKRPKKHFRGPSGANHWWLSLCQWLQQHSISTFFLGHLVECFPKSNFALILPWSFIILFNQIFGQQSCTMIISFVGFWENAAWDITAWDHTANNSCREKTDQENKRSQHHLSFTKGPEKEDWQAGKITCYTSLNIKVMTVLLLQPDKNVRKV